MGQSTLITLSDPRSPVSEAYRTLRTNLEFSSLDHPIETLLAVSPGEDEDRPITVANLAVVMAEGGRRVVLVDADMRKPFLHTLFGVSNEEGLSTFMQQADWEHVPLQPTEVESLRLLPAGPLPPNPAVLLGSKRVVDLLARLKQEADLVLLTAPPVLAVTDAALLAAQVDGVLLLVRAGATPKEHVVRARELLQRVNARVLGAALTNAPRDSVLTGYYR